MAKKKMTYEIYSQKKEKLESRAKLLKKRLSDCEKELKEVTEEIKSIDEEYILLCFRNSGKSVAEYTGIIKSDTSIADVGEKPDSTNSSLIETQDSDNGNDTSLNNNTVAFRNEYKSNSNYNTNTSNNTNFSGGLKI